MSSNIPLVSLLPRLNSLIGLIGIGEVFRLNIGLIACTNIIYIYIYIYWAAQQAKKKFYYVEVPLPYVIYSY